MNSGASLRNLSAVESLHFEKTEKMYGLFSGVTPATGVSCVEKLLGAMQQIAWPPCMFGQGFGTHESYLLIYPRRSLARFDCRSNEDHTQSVPREH